MWGLHNQPAKCPKFHHNVIRKITLQFTKKQEAWRRNGNERKRKNVKRRQGKKMAVVCPWCRLLVQKGVVSKFRLGRRCANELRVKVSLLFKSAEIGLVSGERYLCVHVRQRSLIPRSLRTCNEILGSWFSEIFYFGWRLGGIDVKSALEINKANNFWEEN